MPFRISGIRVLVLEVLDVVPAEAGLVALPGGHRAPRLDEASGDVALAPGIGGGIDGDGECVIARIHRALHHVVDPGVVAAHIKLEDLRPGAPPRRLPPAPAAVTELTMIGTPNAEAARPAVAAPPGWNDSSDPTGARITGSRSLRPNNVVPSSIFETSTQRAVAAPANRAPAGCGATWFRSRPRRPGSPRCDPKASPAPPE